MTPLPVPQPDTDSPSAPRIKRKVCMLGTFAVGKTSLVRRFVKGIFDDTYLTTMGAKVDKKTVELDDITVDLVLWDLNGEDRFQSLSMDYVRGAAGYLLVIDHTRPASLETAHTLHQRVVHTIGPVPFVLVVNKTDLPANWPDRAGDLAALAERGWDIVETSAKTGMGVDAAFGILARRVVAR